MATCEHVGWSACLCVCRHLRRGLSSAWRCEVIGALSSDWSNTQHAALKRLIKEKTESDISMTLHTLMTLKVPKFKTQFYWYYLLLSPSCHLLSVQLRRHFESGNGNMSQSLDAIVVCVWLCSSWLGTGLRSGWQPIFGALDIRLLLQAFKNITTWTKPIIESNVISFFIMSLSGLTALQPYSDSGTWEQHIMFWWINS